MWSGLSGCRRHHQIVGQSSSIPCRASPMANPNLAPFCPRPKVEYGFSAFARLKLRQVLAIGTECAYLALASPSADARIVNPQERNEDEPISPIHHPCKLHARTHPFAHCQTLARDLSQQTNVISSHLRRLPPIEPPALAAIPCIKHGMAGLTRKWSIHHAGKQPRPGQGPKAHHH